MTAKPPYTLPQAKEIVERVLLTAIKMRSNLEETYKSLARDIGQSDAEFLKLDLTPELFADPSEKINILTSAKLISEKTELEPIDLYNLLYICAQSRTMGLGYVMRWDEDLPKADKRILQGWREE